MVVFVPFRDNNTKILEHLRDIWTKDRRAEWSIWMVYSKVEMPHHFISGVDDTSNHSSHKRATSALKLNDVSYIVTVSVFILSPECKLGFIHPIFTLMQPSQVAATRAELHRRSIAQMRVCFLSCFISYLVDL